MGHLTDASSGEPIPFCNVVDTASRAGAACDADGMFLLAHPAGTCVLRFSALGYEPRVEVVRVLESGTTHVHIAMRAVGIRLHDEVLIEGTRGSSLDAKDDRRLTTTEDALRLADGVTLMRRGSFAQEASVRGMGGDRVGVVIDGMKIHGACSDHMDPVSAYVEAENLDRLNVGKGGFDLTQAQVSGGSVGLVTRKPDFRIPFSAEAEAGWESAAGTQRARAGANGLIGDDVALRGTFSMRKASDFRAGGGESIAHSGYSKINYKADAAWKPAEAHKLSASFIGDDAWDVGFPALIMDTRRTASAISSLEHMWLHPAGWIPSIRTIAYFNRIDHWMDDRDRDVTARTVMPNMHMPMYGRTRTAGARTEIAYAGGVHTGSLVIEYSHLDAFADMWMQSLIPGSRPTYLVNLGDVTTGDAAVILSHTLQASDALLLRATARGDLSVRGVGLDFARRELLAFSPGTQLNRTIGAGGASVSAEYAADEHLRLRASLAAGQRIPSHLESYGYYSYNYVDGTFVIGNPALRPETSLQAELSSEYAEGRNAARLTTWANHVLDYITGVPIDVGYRHYRNISSASLAGVEARGSVGIDEAFDASGTLACTWGQNDETHEPLPLIAPLTATIAAGWSAGFGWIGTDVRAAIAQHRIAAATTLEDATPGWVEWNLRTRIPVGSGISLTAGVENLLDRRYHDHLSVNNLPAPGRNFHLSLSWTFSEAPTASYR